MPTYPGPEENPACKCKGNPVQAFFCHTGHMLECHYPYSCLEAGCSHLRRYEFDDHEIEEIEAEVHAAIQAGARPPYKLDEDGHIIVDEEQLERLEKE